MATGMQKSQKRKSANEPRRALIEESVLNMRLLGLLTLALPLCAASTRATSILDQAPLRFEQGAGANRFVVRGLGLGVQLRDNEARIQVRGDSGTWRQIRVTLPGANSSTPVGVSEQVTKTSIFRGPQSEWPANPAWSI